MTRRILIVFALSLVITYPLVLGVFGPSGALHNRALTQEVANLTYQNEVLALQTQSLKEQKQSMAGSDALMDAAFRYGYQSEGEQVYYFDQNEESSIQNKAPQKVAESKKPSFGGMGTGSLVGITLVISLVITILYAIIHTKKGRENSDARR